MLGDAKPRRDLPLRQPLHPLEQEDLPASRRKPGDEGLDPLEREARRRLALGSGPLIRDGGGKRFRKRRHHHQLRAAQPLEVEVADGLEQIGFGPLDMGDRGEPGNPAIGLLDQILGIRRCHPLPPQPGTHRRLLRHDVGGDPSDDLGRCRGHGRLPSPICAPKMTDA